MLLCSECGQPIPDDEVMSAAAKLRVSMRKAHRGGRKPQPHACKFCGEVCMGLRALEDHVVTCPARLMRQMEPLQEGDLVAWVFP
jgi:hypothetical protein